MILTGDAVQPCATVDNVVTDPARDDVVTVAAIQKIIAQQAANLVTSRAAENLIRIADFVSDVLRTDGTEPIVKRIAAKSRWLYYPLGDAGRIVVIAIENIVAAPADEPVLAAAAHQHIIAVASHYQIPAEATCQPIPPLPAADTDLTTLDIRTDLALGEFEAAEYPVVAGPPGQDVQRQSALDQIITATAL